MSEANKALVRRLREEAISTGNLALIDELLTENYLYHGPSLAGEIRGIEAFKQFLLPFTKAFPDRRETISHQIAEGDMVATRFSFTGTHKGDLMGIAPTGVTVTLTGIEISRIVDGRIVEAWVDFDSLALLQQLGVFPQLQAAKDQPGADEEPAGTGQKLERFSNQEAKDKVGRKVRSVLEFAGIQKGTNGRVVGTALDPRGFTVEIAWTVPGRAEPLIKKVTKTEYENYLIEL